MPKLLQILIAFFVPPVSVIMNKGVGIHLIINIILWLMFYLPGSFHALYLLLSDKSVAS